MSSDFVGVPVAAEYLGLSVRRVQQFAEKGRIGQKIGRDYLFSWDELRHFKRKPRKAGRPPRNP